ncbi:MAG: cbb3-type cytochrome oxidase assembly protein CcoS [Betaproteobacteria bacterium]|nr:cbb3-type cytochrome oxidase assembly protein CcoS [Betaproteobacteria bacterium]
MEESLYLLIPISVLIVFIIGAMFWWALRSGQYDDLEGPAYRILFDDRDEPVRRKDDTGTAEEGRLQKP